MKNAQELIDAIKDVPEERFNQNVYFHIYETGCGCVMHHFEVHKFGKLVQSSEIAYHGYFDLQPTESSYIFGKRSIINRIGFQMNWPTYEEFTVQAAIERIKFIDNLNKERNEKVD